MHTCPCVRMPVGTHLHPDTVVTGAQASWVVEYASVAPARQLPGTTCISRKSTNSYTSFCMYKVFQLYAQVRHKPSQTELCPGTRVRAPKRYLAARRSPVRLQPAPSHTGAVARVPLRHAGAARHSAETLITLHSPTHAIGKNQYTLYKDRTRTCPAKQLVGSPCVHIQGTQTVRSPVNSGLLRPAYPDLTNLADSGGSSHATQRQNTHMHDGQTYDV